MRNLSRSQIRRIIIQEHYRMNLIEQLYEQAAPTPPDDPTAAAAGPDPASPDPGAAADPTATATAAADPTAAPDPTAIAADPTAAAAPTPDPTAALALPPTAGSAAGAPPAAPPPVTGAPATGAPATGAKTIIPDEKSKIERGTDEEMKVNAAGMAAIKQASAKGGDIAVESLRRRSLKFLLEQDSKEPEIDMEAYAGKIANLINNYTSLIDVKKNVMSQSFKFLDDNFPTKSGDLKKELERLLRVGYHISLERPEPQPDSYAVGAKSGSGGAA